MEKELEEEKLKRENQSKMVETLKQKEEQLQEELVKKQVSWTSGCVEQSVTCLAILARSYTFVEINHEIISTVILLPSAESFKKGCCQLQVKVWAWSTS